MEARDQQLFIDNVSRRVAQLIATGVWEGIDEIRVATWLRQFEQHQCTLLAACLLDNLIYRSKKQVLALFKAALTCHRILPTDAESDLRLIELLRGRADPLMRLVPVISLDLPPTKSGPYMLRLLARDLQLQDRWMVWPERLPEVPETVTTLLAVDDFCGSGRQFCERFLDLQPFLEFRKTHPNCKIIYVAAAAHADGIASIRKHAKDVEVVAGEVLSKEHHFFEGTSLEKYNDADLKAELLRQHEQMARGRGLGGKIGEFGFESQSLTYGFAHGTPNNTLPMLWYDTDTWTPLLDR